MDIYRQEILDHFKHPRNFGELTKATHKAMDRNASCGDVLEMSLRVEKGKVVEVKFKGEGCAVSMAGASMLTEMIKGKKAVEIMKLGDKDIERMLKIKISPARKKCAGLGLVVCQKSLLTAI
ncbi:MAG: iron-sulfur cluster assembly scaffold protein [Candidatus Beckwithbacteria bacterium]